MKGLGKTIRDVAGLVDLTALDRSMLSGLLGGICGCLMTFRNRVGPARGGVLLFLASN
jgi:hypothetical protein